MAQLVFRSENSASLWSLKAIHAMCEMEQSKVGHPAPPLLCCTNPPSFQSPTCTKFDFTAPKLNVPPKHYFKKSRCFRKSLLCLTDSLPGSIWGLVPAAREGGGRRSVQERMLPELVSGELPGCSHQCFLLPQPHVSAGKPITKKKCCHRQTNAHRIV